MPQCLVTTCEHDHPVGNGTVADEGLAPVEHVLIADLAVGGGGGDACRVRTGTGLGQRVGGEQAISSEPAQIFALLLFASRWEQWCGGEVVDGDDGTNAGATVVDLFEYEDGVEHWETETIELGRHLEVDQADLPSFAQQLGWERLGLIIVPSDRNDLGSGEAPSRLFKLLLFCGESETEHGAAYVSGNDVGSPFCAVCAGAPRA